MSASQFPTTRVILARCTTRDPPARNLVRCSSSSAVTTARSEELYLGIAAAAHQHGYSVLTYEGPGQGGVLREQGLTMVADWEKPNAAVLDAFLGNQPKPRKIVLLGESLGGYLAPRAQSRCRLALAVANGEWVFGVHGMFAVLDAFKAYSLAPVAARIRQDVLLLAGTEDHFVPIEQLEQTRQALIGARSVTTVSFDSASGGSLHCQMDAPSLWQGVLFDWMAAKLGSPNGLPDGSPNAK